MNYNIIAAILIVLVTVPMGAASSGWGAVDAGADMIATGIDLAITRIADSLMGTGTVSGTNTTGNSTTGNNTVGSNSRPTVTEMIIGFASWSVSPFEYATVIKLMGISLCCAAVFLVIYALCGAAYVSLSRMSSSKMGVLQHILNTKSDNGALRNYAQNIVMGCLAVSFMALAIFMTLLLSKVLKMMIMSGIANSISPSLSSVSVLYLSMAIMWICVSVFFAISNIVICLTAGLSFLLGALYASDKTRHIATRWLDYFLGMVAMQVFVVVVVAVTVGFVMDFKSSPDGFALLTAHPQIEVSMYIGLIVFVMIGCVGFVSGKARLLKGAKTVVKLVV